MSEPNVLIVFTNAPDAGVAETIGRAVVANGVAACVNILAPCRSIFRWEGETQTTVEVPMIIKTTPERYPALEAIIVAAHPYDVPEIVAVPVEACLEAYGSWVISETRDPHTVGVSRRK